MCFQCQTLDPTMDTYDNHGLTGPTAAPTADDTSSGTGPTKPVYTLDEVAHQLTHGYWQDGGGDWRAFDVMAGDTLTVNIDGLDATGQATALEALAAWTAVSGLQFVTTSGEADIDFDDEDSGAYAYSYVYSSWNEIDRSFVNVDPGWQGYGQYYLQTYIHEIGHALGLGHGGNYNGSADFDSQAHYANDSWQMSVMSYFAQWENPNVDASGLYLAAPQMADILAIQTLYGTPDAVHAGDTVYGDGTTLTATGMDLARDRAVTIFDSSGIDLIDLGSRGFDQRLSLLAESWSDLDGRIGNFAIARGAMIENAITGSGNDLVTGNAAANMIRTGAGSDTIKGGEGDDTIDGGEGFDTVLYEGDSSGFVLAWDGALKITDTNSADGGNDGTDTLIGIERLSFTDGAFGTVEDEGGTTKVKLFQTGGTLTSAVLKVDVSDGYDWQTISRSFTETGQSDRQINTYDDGRVLELSFADGLRDWSTMTDTADVFGWHSYTDSFDATGTKTTNNLTWDDGRIVETFYDIDGLRTGTRMTDGDDHFLWNTIERALDSSGAVTSQTNSYDDGRVIEIDYTDGQRSAMTVTDAGDIATWSSYSDRFDTTTGARLSREMQFDDGRQVQITYDGARMVSHTQIDNADDFAWSSVERSWDAEGTLLGQTNTYDDGMLLEIAFANGVRSSSVTTDVQDHHAWSSLNDTFDSTGTLVERLMVWDDGREEVITYDDQIA